MKRILLLLFTLLLAPLAVLHAAELALPSKSPDVIYDLVVYGDSSGAVIAAISATREGRSVIWVNPTRFPAIRHP